LSSELSHKAEALRQRLGLSFDQVLAMRFAVNVGISTAIVWNILHYTAGANPVLAIASMVAASDPQPEEARKMFRARLINSLVGCVIGLVFILIGGAREWLLPLGLAVTVLISSLVVRIKSSWLQAPITAAVVIGSGIVHGSAATGISYGLRRVAEIFLACLVGMLVSWAMSRIWIIKTPKST
jgi:uncharacterized membrane protein YccC